MATDNQGVVYDIKELLALLNDKADRIDRKVDEGTQRISESMGRLDYRVTVLEQRPDLEPRVRTLEVTTSEDKGERAGTRIAWRSAQAILAAVIGWLSGHHF